MNRQDRDKIRSMVDAAVKGPGTESQKQTFLMVAILEVLFAIQIGQSNGAKDPQ